VMENAGAASTADAGQAAPRKRAGRLASAGVIIEAATVLFLRNGYAGTSMDDIAALAGVSKQTIYTHFADKERLFTDLILRNTERVDDFLEALADKLNNSHDLEKDLGEVARRYVNTVIRPEVLQRRRIVIGEAGRFPEMARTYYEQVPERVLISLASHLQRLAERGLLQVDDARLAADHFAALILYVAMDRAMFSNTNETLTAPELDHLADAGVRVFMAAYGRP
jgi:TetR/AcrR family transcriptional repressor of mexJK operon